MIYHSPSCFKRQFGTSGRCGQMLLMADNKAIEKLFCGTAFFFQEFRFIASILEKTLCCFNRLDVYFIQSILKVFLRQYLGCVYSRSSDILLPRTTGLLAVASCLLVAQSVLSCLLYLFQCFKNGLSLLWPLSGYMF